MGLMISVTTHHFKMLISLKLNAILISLPAPPTVISSHKHTQHNEEKENEFSKSTDLACWEKQ